MTESLNTPPLLNIRQPEKISKIFPRLIVISRWLLFNAVLQRHA